MPSADRAQLAAISATALLSAAFLLALVSLGAPPTTDEGVPAEMTASPSMVPSFGLEPMSRPIPDCGPRADPSSLTSGFHRVVGTMELDGIAPDARSSLAYLPQPRILLVSPGHGSTGLETLTLFGDRGGTVSAPLQQADLATVLAFDPSRPTLAAVSSVTPHLSLVDLGPDGTTPEDGLERLVDLRGFGLGSLDAVSAHASSRSLYLLDAANLRVVRLELAQPTPRSGAERVQSACQIPVDGAGSPVAVAVRQQDAHPFVLSRDGAHFVLREFDPSGTAYATFQLGPTDLSTPTSMVFAPSGDPTDDDSSEQLYVLDAGLEGVARVVAVSFDPPPEKLPRPILQPTLVRVVETGGWAPPSTDPTGIVWDATRRLFIITDSEIDEEVAFDGVNAWSLAPNLEVRHVGLLRPSLEPTDIAHDPDRNLYFVSDDSRKAIFVIDPGADGLPGTRDDRVSEISTTDFGSIDPEGLTFGQGNLFIADGLARQIYRISPGPNGVFDGVAPRGDDQVFHFDVASLGLTDPEGIAFDEVRATLFVVDRSRRGPIAEITTSGELVRTVDLSALGMTSPSGIEIAPSSEDPSLRSFYLVDRGADNASSPGVRDGRLFEIKVDGLP